MQMIWRGKKVEYEVIQWLENQRVEVKFGKKKFIRKWREFKPLIGEAVKIVYIDNAIVVL